MQPQQLLQFGACGIRCDIFVTLQGAQPQGQGGGGARPVLPPQPTAPRKRGRPPKQPMVGLAPPVSGGAAGVGALGKEAEDRRVRVWWPDDKVGRVLRERSRLSLGLSSRYMVIWCSMLRGLRLIRDHNETLEKSVSSLRCVEALEMTHKCPTR